MGAAYAALTLTAVLGVTACGGETPVKAAPPKAHVRFRVGPTTPTSTIATPVSRPTIGPQGVPLQTGPFLAPATTTILGTPVDGILCQQYPQQAYRANVRLRVYTHGHPRALPGGIGMIDAVAKARPGGLIYSASTCYYWLHTRAADGVIVIQSPRARGFTLGDFFKVWNQPLSTTRVAGLHGPVTVLINNKRWQGLPAAAPLHNNENITLAVGTPVPHPAPTDWFAADL